MLAFLLAGGLVVAGLGAVFFRAHLDPSSAPTPDPYHAEPTAPWRTLRWRFETGQDLALVGHSVEHTSAPGSQDYAVTYGVERKGPLRRPVEVGRVTVTERRLQNGDTFLFVRLLGTASPEVDLRFILELDGNRFDFTDFAQREKPREHHPVTGVDPTTYPAGLLHTYHYDRTSWSVMVGRQYLSRPLVLRYDQGGRSRLRELVEERKAMSIAQDGSVVRLEIPLTAPAGHIAEHWLVASRQPLFREPDALSAWIDRSIDDHHSVNRWYTADGTLTKLPWSVEPFTRMGYGRHLTNIAEVEALEQYAETRERYFVDLVLNAVTVLHRLRDPELRIWLTDYTSTWLKKPYGITAPYVDTRHNATVGRFLADARRLFHLPELQDADLPYADFLVEQARAGRVIRTGSGGRGFLLFDYFVPGRETATHASLNHALAEMNYLLLAYLRTGNGAYLEVARGIRRGIEALGDRWIRDDGDLWYQVNPDLTFAGDDYLLLTLYDLLEAGRHWEAVGEPVGKAFRRLTAAKTAFLVEKGVALPPELQGQLRDGGFGYLIDGGNS